MHDLIEVQLAQDEWRAWRRMCEVLREVAVNINEETRLHATIVAWGEELVALRSRQTPELRARVLNEKRADAERLAGDVVIP